jgi:hypothetical protein
MQWSIIVITNQPKNPSSAVKTKLSKSVKFAATKAGKRLLSCYFTITAEEALSFFFFFFSFLSLLELRFASSI